jgi:hypothetical protein
MIHAHAPILSQSQKYRMRTLEGLEGLEAFLLEAEVLLSALLIAARGVAWACSRAVYGAVLSPFAAPPLSFATTFGSSFSST